MSDSNRLGVVNVLTKYDRRGATCRVRFRNLMPDLQARGWEFNPIALLSDATLAEFYRTGRHDYRRIARDYARFVRRLRQAPRHALWWVEKELLAGLPSALEGLLLPVLPRAVIDYDDAVYLQFNDEWLGALGRAHKFRRYARRAAWLTVGSEALRARFSAWGAARVRKIPSTVPVDRYPVRPHAAVDVVTIGWIGTPMTARFLEPMRDVLRALAPRLRLRLCVVGAAWECPGVEVVTQPWSEADETRLVGGFDLGIMPLPDGPWERAKCAYKLIQYMAAGVVPVGSRVGENAVVIEEGVNGCLASTPGEWRETLERLGRDPALRARLGAAARAKALALYDNRCAAQAVHEVFSNVAAAAA